MSRHATLPTLLAAVALAGCDGSDEQEPEPQPPPPPPPRETIHHLGELPDDFERHINRRGGFAFAAPRGWKVSDRGEDSVIRSFDRLVAISIVPARSKAALGVPVDEFATRTAEALPGFRKRLRLEGEAPLDHRYDGAEVRATGTAKGGVKQRVSVIVLHRDEVVTFTVVIAKNAKEATGPSKRLAERIVETLRSRPPRAGGDDEKRAGGGDDEKRAGGDNGMR